MLLYQDSKYPLYDYTYDERAVQGLNKRENQLYFVSSPSFE